MKQTKMLTFLIIISFLSFLIFLTKSLINDKINSSSYIINNKTNYQVTLKDNEYFQEETDYYVSKAIKEVLVNFDYELNNQNNKNILYSYTIDATLKGLTDNETKLVWLKKKNLEKENNLKDSKIKIEKNYPIDYDYYASYVKSFESTYNLKIDAFLEINLAIKSNDKKIDTYVKVTIPINDKVSEITINEDKEFLNDKKTNYDNVLTFIFLILFIILIIFRNKPQNILKEYQDSIIKLSKEPNLNNLNLIVLDNLKDLFKVLEDNNTLIFNYQNNYYCFINNTIYLYSS